ncbi:MAG: hypothetical protein GY719_12775 [bacterium]|nr:hypothetical protein [bacterium]
MLALITLTLSAPVSVQAQKATPPPAPPASQPTKAPPEPTQAPEPTKEPVEKPPPVEPTKEPTETPLPTSTPNPVPTAEPTLEKPTVAPTPTPGQAKPTLAPTPLGEEMTSGTPVPSMLPESGGEALDSASVTTATLTPPQVTVITGLVFDDRDGDGVQDPGERGIGGVPVTLDGEVVGATGVDGRFSLPQSDADRALLAIVPPTGWQWVGGPFDTGEALDDVVIPLHQLEPVAVSANTPPTTVVVAGVALAALLAFNGVTSLLQALAVRSLTRAFRRQKSQELEWAMAGELIEHQESLREQLDGDPRGWQRQVRQLLTDARVGGGEDVPLMLGDVSVSHPAFEVVGDTARYTFTTDPDRARGNRLARWRNWRDRVISLDTAISPFARVDAQVLWGHLAARKQDGFVLSRRNMAWYVVVRRRR